MTTTADTAEVWDLIERSSLGTPGARQLRARTPAVVVERILARARSLTTDPVEVVESSPAVVGPARRLTTVPTDMRPREAERQELGLTEQMAGASSKGYASVRHPSFSDWERLVRVPRIDVAMLERVSEMVRSVTRQWDPAGELAQAAARLSLQSPGRYFEQSVGVFMRFFTEECERAAPSITIDWDRAMRLVEHNSPRALVMVRTMTSEWFRTEEHFGNRIVVVQSKHYSEQPREPRPDQVGRRRPTPPPLDCLRSARRLAEAVIITSGGNGREADRIADELVAYVDFNWISLRLNVLARDPRVWEAHLTREVYRRWLANLQRGRGRWAVPVGESQAESAKGKISWSRADPRRLIDHQGPRSLDEFGLVGAVRHHVATLGLQPSPLVVTVDAMTDMRGLPTDVEVGAFLIICEAVENVRRHAGARRCTISLSVDEHWLNLEVRDDGRGLAHTARYGVGLSSMEARAEELSGDLCVESSPGAGTLVRARIAAAVRPGTGALGAHRLDTVLDRRRR